jgi:hypothetical protein
LIGPRLVLGAGDVVDAVYGVSPGLGVVVDADPETPITRARTATPGHHRRSRSYMSSTSFRRATSMWAFL